MTFNEPIPDFRTRFPDRLESCIATPFQSFGRKSLYQGLVSKATILFYLLVKNHPFQNGNKRIAITSLLTFLAINGKWLRILQEDLYEITVIVAGSKPGIKNAMIAAIKETIQAFLVDA